MERSATSCLGWEWIFLINGPVGLGVLALSPAAPLLPIRRLRSRSLIGGNLVQLAAGMAAFGQGFLLTQYAQSMLGWSAVEFGLATVALPVMAVVGSMLGQRLVTRLGARLVAAVSMVLLGAGCLLWTGLGVDSGYAADLMPGLLVFGLGLGDGVASAIAAMSEVAPAGTGVASGITNAAFQIGGALGVAVLSTVAASAGDFTSGVRTAFVVAAALAAVGLVVAVSLLGRRRTGDVVPVS